MAFKAINLRNFGGGLNTAVADSLLPPNQSADMMNFDILETGALKVRRGWKPHSTGPAADQPIRHIGLLSASSGLSYWCVAASEGIYTAPFGDTVPYAVKYGYEFSPQPTSATLEMVPWYSGGVSRVLNGTAEYSIPLSDRITVYHDPHVGASIKVDAGAWSNSDMGNSYTTFSGLSGTNHTVYIKPAAADTNSFELTGSDSNDHHFTYVEDYVYYPTAQFDSQTTHHFSFDFYDLGGTSIPYADQAWGACIAKPDDYTFKYYNCLVGAVGEDFNNQGDNTHYTFQWKPDDFGGVVATHEHTTMERSTGWHTAWIKFKLTSGAGHYYFAPVAWGVDEESHTVNCYPNETTDKRVYMGGYGGYTGSSGNPAAFVDNFRLEGYLVEDCSSLTGWTTGGHNEDSAINSTYYNSARIVDVQYFGYEYVPDWNLEATTPSIHSHGMAQMNNKLWIGLGNKQAISFDGSLAGSITGTCLAMFMVQMKRRLFGSGDWLTPDRSLLVAGSIDAGNDWRNGTWAGYLQGKDRDYRGCTGMTVWENKLLWFGEHTMYGLDASDADEANWVSEEISSTHGCIAPETLVAFPRGVIFLADDGVRAFGYIENVNTTDGSGLLMLSENINDIIRDVDKAYLVNACGAFFENKYYLSLPLYGNTENSHILVGDLEQRTPDGQPVWTIYDIAGITAMFVHDFDGYKLYGGNTSGDMVELMTGTVDGPDEDPINAYYQMPPSSSLISSKDSYDTVKHYRRVSVFAQSDAAVSMTVTPTTDDVYAPPAELNIGETSEASPEIAKISSRGHFLKLKLQTTVEDALTVTSVTIVMSSAIRVK